MHIVIGNEYKDKGKKEEGKARDRWTVGNARENVGGKRGIGYVDLELCEKLCRDIMITSIHQQPESDHPACYFSIYTSL